MKFTDSEQKLAKFFVDREGEGILDEIREIDFIEAGIIDSLDLVSLAVFIEQNFNESIWQKGFVNLVAIRESEWALQERHYEGAKNRALALKDRAAREKQSVDFFVGIEGGLEEVKSGMEAFAWVVIKSRKGKVGKGRSGSFFLPAKVVKLVKAGKELGEADDIVFPTQKTTTGFYPVANCGQLRR